MADAREMVALPDGSRVPAGYELVARFAGGEVWNGKGEVVVLASPRDDAAEDEHDCDALGCSSVGYHVVWRGVSGPGAASIGATASRRSPT